MPAQQQEQQQQQRDGDSCHAAAERENLVVGESHERLSETDQAT